MTTSLRGFGEAADHDIRIDNRKAGAGMRITSNRPLANTGYWSIRTVMAVEPALRCRSNQPAARGPYDLRV